MENVKIIWLESGDSKEQWKISCHTMWQDIFHDSDDYLDYYERYKWPVNQVVALTVEGRLCSMLHLNPYQIRQGDIRRELHYIVGVSTEEKARGRGYMGLLLREAFRYLYDRGEAWTYLMPAAEAIYLPFGFRSVAWAQSVEDCFRRREDDGRNGNAGRESRGLCGDGGTAERAYSFEKCSDGKKKELELFAEKCLSRRFGVYPVHSGTYFQELSRELKACGGELLVLEREGEIVGYTAYMYDPGEEIPVEIAETVLEEGKQEQGYAMIREYLLSRCERKELRVLFTESAFLPDRLCVPQAPHCQIMARILDFKEAARDLERPEGWPERLCCRITDAFMEENDGVWELCFDGEKTAVRKTQDRPAICLDIGEFTALFFRQNPLYINDMV